MNNSKYIESDMARDDDSGMWIYEMPSVVLNSNDIVEYWFYVEKSNLGYLKNQIFRVQGEYK
jgi:Carbohydrate binding domain (family 32)